MATATTTEEPPVTQGIDEAIGRMENLYRTVTGSNPPPAEGYAPIPVERDPSQFVEEQIDRLLSLLSPLERGAPGMAWSPPLASWESETEILICVDLPGVARKDVEVTLQGNVLTVRGQRPATAAAGFQLRVAERPMGPFLRKILLPPAARTSEPRAQMKDGVLEIRISREAPPSESARSVPVN